MPLTSSGAISLNEMHIEAGGTSASEASINDTDIIDMIGKTAGTAMSFNEWYGASSGYSGVDQTWGRQARQNWSSGESEHGLVIGAMVGGDTNGRSLFVGFTGGTSDINMQNKHVNLDTTSSYSPLTMGTINNWGVDRNTECYITANSRYLIGIGHGGQRSAGARTTVQIYCADVNNGTNGALEWKYRTEVPQGPANALQYTRGSES